MRQQRLNDLLDLVSERGHVSIADVQQSMGVSAATARRDINQLAEQQLVTRSHGGASALGSGYELPLQYKIARQADAKLAIARALVELIAPAETLAFNGGTTTTEAARLVGRTPRLTGDADITIVTNALNIAYELSIRPHVRIVVTGGTARAQSYELVGPLGDDVLGRINVDTAVLGADGVSGRHGLTTLQPAEARVSARFIDVARRVIVLADSSKLGKVTFATIAPLSQVDVLITDQEVEPELRAELVAAGVELVIAD